MMDRTIGVIGLGRIGLPLALSLCEKGFHVIGVDVDAQKIDELQAGRTDIDELSHGETLQTILRRHLMKQSFYATTRVSEAAWYGNAYIVTVGIPVEESGDLNDRPLRQAVEQLGRVIKPNDLVLIRSTLAPGMMEHTVIPMLEESSRMLAGQDFHVAYAAERVAEGEAMHEFQTLDIVLAGLTPRCADIAKDLLSKLTSGTIHMTNLRIAQAVKVVENAQRDVNIALAQQLSDYASHHDIDVYELIRLANTHPRVRLLEPGMGVGGFCIPNAYHYLKASIPQSKKLPLFELSRNINEMTPAKIVAKLTTQLSTLNKAVKDCSVAILGLGMKDNSNDTRLSPAIACAELLVQMGATVRAFDPTVSIQLPYQVSTLAECLEGADGIMVCAWQAEFENLDIVGALNLGAHPMAIVDLRHRLAAHLETWNAERRLDHEEAPTVPSPVSAGVGK